jgi:hypothetical protein
MYQPLPPGGQPARPLRPPAPAPVLAAVKVMYAGAAISTVPLIVALAYSGDIQAYHIALFGHRLTAAQIIVWRPLIIAVVIIIGLIVPAAWLWMARANGEGRNWARVLSTVLFGLATLQVAGNMKDGVALFLIAVLAWLAGLAAVWLLWRPAASAFLKPRGFTRAGSGAQLSSRIRSSRSTPDRRIP